MKLKQILSAAAMTAMIAASTNSHATLLIDIAPGTTTKQTQTAGNYVAGTAFTLDTAMTIDGLGWLDIEGNGLAGEHVVGLWRVAGSTLVAQATVNNTSQRVASAQGTAVWYVAEIDDLLLSAGTYRVAGTVLTDNVGLLGSRLGNGVTLGDGYVRNAVGNTGVTYPNNNFTSSAAAVRATVSANLFDAPATAVPEPMSLALWGLGFMALNASRKRQTR